jgi:membrane-associated phospholipid phosphatase
MTRFRMTCALVAALALHPAAALAENAELTATDAITGIVPGVALVTAAFFDDPGEGHESHEGLKQWMRNTGVNQVVVSLLRVGFDQTSLGERPNGKRYGFPSGHEAFVMSGASFLGERYGWKWGVPAYLAAGYVGWVRVKNDKHHWRDVIASAVVSVPIAKLTVTPEHATELAPIVGPDFLGIRWERSF